jgi:hypothetical protein
MRIRKFELTYGGYCATNYELTKHWNKLAFRQWEYSPFENLPRIVKLTDDQWSALVQKIVTIIEDWDPIYDSDTCDGIQWTLILNTDTAKYNFYGSNNFPETFNKLIEAIQSVTGLEKFAEGYNHD